MYQNYPNNYYNQLNYPNNYYNQTNQQNPNDDRFLGLFALPFLLGGVTGAALAPAFYKRPCCPAPYPIPYPAYPTYSYNNYYPTYYK